MKMIKILACCLLLASASAWSAGHTSEADKPSFAASRTQTVSAVVTAINHETRDVTLETSDGFTTSFVASPDVRNLEQVETGDRVFAELYEEVTISVHGNPEGAEPNMGELQAMARAEKGEMPGGVMSDTVIITAVVEEINLDNNTFKLRGPEGNIREFVARNPENLKKADVGDLVVITITTAIGILVEHPDTAG